MTATSDNPETPLGLYLADLTTGTIEKALLSQVPLWDVAFSPDHTGIAYRTYDDSDLEIGIPPSP